MVVGLPFSNWFIFEIVDSYRIFPFQAETNNLRFADDILLAESKEDTQELI